MSVEAKRIDVIKRKHRTKSCEGGIEWMQREYSHVGGKKITMYNPGKR